MSVYFQKQSLLVRHEDRPDEGLRVFQLFVHVTHFDKLQKNVLSLKLYFSGFEKC